MNETNLYYGVISNVEIHKLARGVVNVLGGGVNASYMLLETSAVETLMGTFPDRHPDRLGVGLCQHDDINIDDIKKFLKERHRTAIKHCFDYDIAEIELADLAYDPKLSLICCRLSYMRIEDAIPGTRLARANYWKDHYNRSGKGTVDEYMLRTKHCLGEEVL